MFNEKPQNEFKIYDEEDKKCYFYDITPYIQYMIGDFVTKADIHLGYIFKDDSEFEQHCDVADLNSFAELKYDYFKHYGFTKMDVYLCMDMKEINMGYQHVNFYYSEKQDTAYRFSEHVCEVGGSSLQTEYTVMVFYRLNVPLSTFDNSDPDDYAKFVARYSASGSLEDDWQNMAIYLCIIYHN